MLNRQQNVGVNPKHSLRERLMERRALFGLLQAHPNHTLTEIAAICGYDFVMLDGEHGLLSSTDFSHAIQVLSTSHVLSFARLPNHDSQEVGKYLDIGANVIVAPNVSTVEEARNLSRAMAYPPSGTRSVGASLHRVTSFGRDRAEYLKAPKANASLLVIIESAQGVSNAHDILGVDGVDGVIVGPADLAADLGRPGDFAQPGFADALAAVESAAISSRKIIGTAPHPGNSQEELLARGYRLLILGSDVSLISDAMRAQLASAAVSLDSVLRSKG